MKGNELKFKNVYSIGFWGAPNIGDELICKTVNELVLKFLLKENSINYILTQSKLVTRDYIELDSSSLVGGFFPKPEYYFNFKEHLNALYNSELVTIGGGGLISDRYSFNAVPRYLIDTLLAIMFNKKIAFIGIGVLPLKSKYHEKLVKFVFKHASLIYVRDNFSYDNIKLLSSSLDVVIGPDLSLVSKSSQKSIESIESIEYIVFNIRENPKLSIDRLKILVNSLKHFKIMFLCAEPEDTIIYEEIINVCELRTFEIITPNKLSECESLISNASMVFAERLHVIALSLKYNKKSLFLIYEEKVKHYLQDDFVCSSLTVDDFNTNKPIPNFSFSKKNYSSEQKITEVKTILSRLDDSPMRYSICVRVKSLFIFLTLFLGGACYSMLIVIKRFLFGRGKLKVFGGLRRRIKCLLK